MAQDWHTGWHTSPSPYSPQQLSLPSPLENTAAIPLLPNSSGIPQNSQRPLLDVFDDGERLQSQSEVDAQRSASPYLPISRRLNTEQEIYNKRTTTGVRRSRPNHNPITESFQYRAYRTRQAQQRDSQKWPADLEDAFLDAFLDVPKLGKLMFSINGKPHGRNQLIALYLWIAYLGSLPPGVQPDEAKRRTKKQVSSHIQVLKGFMQGHPAYPQLFPSTDEKSNYSNKDLLDNDPCLVALSNNRLPYWRSAQCLASTPSIRPYLFDLYRTVSIPGDQYERIHEYSDPKPRRLERSSLEESLPNWRHQFPQLECSLPDTNMDCSVIHCHTSLALQHIRSPNKAELRSRFEIAIPQSEDRLQWHCVQAVYIPKAFYGTSGLDPAVSISESPLSIVSFDESSSPIMSVEFPAQFWPQALEKIDHLEDQFDESQRGGHCQSLQLIVHQYISQLTLYQEISASVDNGRSWTKRVIIVWTFAINKQGMRGRTKWRYLDTSASCQSTFSPKPGDCQETQSTLSGNVNSLNHTSLLSIRPINYDSIAKGLVTPPDTSTMQSPYSQYEYPVQQDVAPENISFMSHSTQESDSTIVEKYQTTHQLNYFLASNPPRLHYMDQGPIIWQAQPSTNSYEIDTYVGSYNTFSSASETAQDFLGNWRGAQRQDLGWPSQFLHLQS